MLMLSWKHEMTCPCAWRVLCRIVGMLPQTDHLLCAPMFADALVPLGKFNRCLNMYFVRCVFDVCEWVGGWVGVQPEYVSE
jgi:hypothetical protein